MTLPDRLPVDFNSRTVDGRVRLTIVGLRPYYAELQTMVGQDVLVEDEEVYAHARIERDGDDLVARLVTEVSFKHERI